jgi:hypothetical protein
MAWFRKASLWWILFCLGRMCDVAPVAPFPMFTIIGGRRSLFPFPILSCALFVVACFIVGGVFSLLLPLLLLMSISNEDDSPYLLSSSLHGRICPLMLHFSMGVSPTMLVGVSRGSPLVDGMCPCVILLPPHASLFLSRSLS